ncbi:unnamed protein product [Hydatigera taeniaeformis]|uniref:Nuclear pore complex protein Nup214 n=1 Tax=Hydatigena taeniaeformis TaxID=6205 RepID=A0A158RDJ7_HYDTA|nr:unnamed protein product [Hydatigera taeniaeformis]
MDSLLTEELHHIPLEISKLQVESNLLSVSPNGLVFIARGNDLIVFSTSDYNQASSSYAQRKDKPLVNFKPTLCITLRHRITWLSVNCSGSLLLLAYGSSIQLLNIQRLSAHSPHGLLGNVLDIPKAEGAIREMAWNPADKHRFALVTTAGSVFMYLADPSQEPHINLIGCLPTSVQVQCTLTDIGKYGEQIDLYHNGEENLTFDNGEEWDTIIVELDFVTVNIQIFLSDLVVSWSPKGKQLALTGIGTLSESTPKSAAMNSTSIVQVDHDLKVKRIIPINALLNEHLKDLTEPRPISILWTSSYCFLLGVMDAKSGKEMRLVFITVLPKSEARLGKLPDFTSFGIGHCRYLMCLVPNSITLATVTWSPDAEECYLLDIPSITASNESPPVDSLPKLIKTLPLPTDSYPVAMHVGALTDSPDPLPLIIGLLANGAVFAFKIFPPKSIQAEDGSAPSLAAITSALSDVRPANTGENSTVEPPSPTQPIIEAANQFWKALRLQAETSANAWNHLHSVFEGNSLNLQQKSDANVVRRGVWDIERSLNNMDDFLRVVEEITGELRKASQLSVNEQTTSADFLDRLNGDVEAFHHRISDNNRVIAAAGLDPGAAAMLASLKRKSRAAESFLAELEDQVESLSAQLDARNERTNCLVGRNRSKSGFSMGDVGSPMEKIQATMATNARLIKCERYRLELISRMAGISISDCSSNNSKNTSTAPSLGGSAVSVDREQRDARIYRMLCAKDMCMTKTRVAKSSGLERLPIAKAPSTVAEVLELMRKEREREESQLIKSTPKSVCRTPLKAVGASSPPKAASQMNLPGQQKNLEISKLLASAASVPPVMLANGHPNSRGSGFSFAIATENVRTSTPVHKTIDKLQPLKGDAVFVPSSQKPPSSGVTSLSKAPIFVPSTSKSLTLPTRATPMAAPTTKVFGAPMSDSGGENFKPLSPRLPSPTTVTDAASTGAFAVTVSRKSPSFIPTSVQSTAQS